MHQSEVYKKAQTDFANLKSEYDQLDKLEKEQENTKTKLMSENTDKESVIKKEQQSEKSLKSLLANLQKEKIEQEKKLKELQEYKDKEQAKIAAEAE